MYRRKKTPRKKARVTRGHAAKKKSKSVKRAVQRRKPMAKKKSTSTWEDEDAAAAEADEGQDGEADPTESEEPEAPVPTETAASDDGVYVVDSDQIAIKSQLYKRGDKVTLTPEELEQVQASGVRILPVE